MWLLGTCEEMKERALLFAAYHSPHMWHLVWSHRGSPAVMQKKSSQKKTVMHEIPVHHA
jgi:hypothetical protein